VNASRGLDDFYAVQGPNAFRLARSMNVEAGADIPQEAFAEMSRRGRTIERPGDSALATPTAARISSMRLPTDATVIAAPRDGG
jgi:hypothetical protein